MFDVFKPTDMLVKSQVTLFLANLHKSILDVPNLFNLREATAEAMGKTVEELMPKEEEEKEEKTNEPSEQGVA